jgi:hypothetical protein
MAFLPCLRFPCHLHRSVGTRGPIGRRKILIGAAILAKVERGEFDEKKLRALLDSVLTRKDDRSYSGSEP